ncbi:unnamed protein product [Wickerhamomyces anomalus]
MLRFQKSSAALGRRGIKTIHKDLKFSNSARIAVLRGAEKVYNAVSVTLGPKGRNVLMEQKYNFPKITKDGYSIAQELTFNNRFENMGCQLIKDVTNKSNLESGDGTTTSTVLAYNILNSSLRHVSVGANPTEIRNGVQLAINKVIEYLESQKQSITSSTQMKQIAVVSSNGDEELGGLIAEAIEQVGKDGIVTIENGNKLENDLVVSKGLRFDQGFINPQFGDVSKPSSKVEYENPLILLYKGELKNSQDILPPLNHAQRSKRPLLIIAEGLTGDALAISILNKLRGQVEVVAVKAPGYGEHRAQYFQDLEAATGSKILDPETGDVASTATKEVFGSAGSIVISPKETIIIDGKGEKAKIDERIEQIETKLNDPATSFSDSEQLQKRLSKLKGGAAIIKPGASVELNNADFGNVSFDTKRGIDIVKKSLASPFNKILSNSGLEGDQLKGKLEGKAFSYGINAQTGELVDLYEAGIIDPFSTIKGALVNASGVTSLLSTTEVAIASVLGEKEGF